jgi:hypothetical protein
MVASTRQGLRPLLEMLERDHGAPEARGMVYQLLRTQYLAGRIGGDDAKPWQETAAEQSVVAGWWDLGSGSWDALRAADAALASIPLEHPLGADARWLRAAWRAHSGDTEDARESGALLDGLLARGADRIEWYLTRAQAHAREGAATHALGALTEMLIAAAGRPIPGVWRRQALEVLGALEPGTEWEAWRASLIETVAAKTPPS